MRTQISEVQTGQSYAANAHVEPSLSMKQTFLTKSFSTVLTSIRLSKKRNSGDFKQLGQGAACITLKYHKYVFLTNEVHKYLKAYKFKPRIKCGNDGQIGLKALGLYLSFYA